MWEQINFDLFVDYATKFFLAAFLGTLLSFRRTPDQYRLHLIEAHALLAIAGALFISIIAGDIIRAVGLMGAASVVRYRYSIQNPRDASTLILSLGVGMACGSDLLAVATVGTLLILFIIQMINLFPQALPFETVASREEMILRMTVSDYDQMMTRVRKIFHEKDIEYSLVSFERKIRKGTLEETVTEVNFHVDMAGDLSLHELTKLIVDDNILRVSWHETGQRTW
jgi:uncharacterized membrane protein YhiD involved in acid resistance